MSYIPTFMAEIIEFIVLPVGSSIYWSYCISSKSKTLTSLYKFLLHKFIMAGVEEEFIIGPYNHQYCYFVLITPLLHFFCSSICETHLQQLCRKEIRRILLNVNPLRKIDSKRGPFNVIFCIFCLTYEFLMQSFN